MLVVLVPILIAAFAAEEQNWAYVSDSSFNESKQHILDRIVDWLLGFTRNGILTENKDWPEIKQLRNDNVTCQEGRVGPLSSIQRNGPANIITNGSRAILRTILNLRHFGFKFKRCTFWGYYRRDLDVDGLTGIIMSNSIQMEMAWNTTKGIKCQSLYVALVIQMGQILLTMPQKPYTSSGTSESLIIQHVNNTAAEVIGDNLRFIFRHIISTVNFCLLFVNYTTLLKT